MKLNKNIEHSIVAFPEEITEDGVKIYGETSYENQMAVLSQYLHNAEINNETIVDKDRRRGIILAIQEFLERKKAIDDIDDIEEYVTMVAEDPIQYPLFAEFFNVPFPTPKSVQFTFIDLFAGMGGFRLAMQAQGGKCVFSSEWNKYAQ